MLDRLLAVAISGSVFPNWGWLLGLLLDQALAFLRRFGCNIGSALRGGVGKLWKLAA